MIQGIRNEAHRFGVSFHRNKRLKTMTISELDNVKGIGEKTKEKIITEYNTISKLKKASLKELTEKLGRSKAELVFRYFKK